ncbi:MAG: hypothetical protein ACNI3H_12515 [Halarcobacter ebronensis]
MRSHLGGDDFNQKIKDIIRQQKQKGHVDDRKDRIVAKIKEYKKKKKEYYLENKDKRLQYDKEYREEKKKNLGNIEEDIIKRIKIKS